jgi:hypothetical protein
MQVVQLIKTKEIIKSILRLILLKKNEPYSSIFPLRKMGKLPFIYLGLIQGMSCKKN